MRTAKHIGLLLVAVGVLAIVLAAALPATITHQGSLQFRADHDQCGSALYAALEYADRSCGRHARARLVWATAIGGMVVIAGVFLLAGRDRSQRSRVLLDR